MAKKVTSLTTNRVGDFNLSIILDKRSNRTSDEYPLSIRFYRSVNGKEERYFHHFNEFYTEKYFNEVCSVSASRSALFPIKKKWESILEGYRTRLAKVAEKQQLSMPLIRAMLSGVDIDGQKNMSFIGIWEAIIATRRKEGRAGTADSYECALRSFRRVVGDIEGFSLNKSVIAKWNDGMKDGIDAQGNFIKQMSDTTRGIYLRACRVVWNECVKQGFLAEVEYPFGNKSNDLISIPRGKKRQKSYLSVTEMTELYNVFIEKRYPKEWGPIYTERAHQSLGLFLAQYLCNGCNLTDIARLTYNAAYWQDGGRTLEFQRRKTAARSNDNSVVVVPIIPPLKRILDEIAAPPTKGGYVFPHILKNVENEDERRRKILMENSNVQDRMNRICKELLGWEKNVSGTWARHSFATNLKLAGVEEEYIAESMGHSHGNDVTAGYMDVYPWEIRYRNNMKLLNIEEKQETPDLDKLSKTELKALLKKLLNV